MRRPPRAAPLILAAALVYGCAAPPSSAPPTTDWSARYGLKHGGTEDDLNKDAEDCLPSKYRLLRTGLLGYGSEGKGLPHSQCMKLKGYTVKSTDSPAK